MSESNQLTLHDTKLERIISAKYFKVCVYSARLRQCLSASCITSPYSTTRPLSIHHYPQSGCLHATKPLSTLQPLIGPEAKAPCLALTRLSHAPSLYPQL